MRRAAGRASTAVEKGGAAAVVTAASAATRSAGGAAAAVTAAEATADTSRSIAKYSAVAPFRASRAARRFVWIRVALERALALQGRRYATYDGQFDGKLSVKPARNEDPNDTYTPLRPVQHAFDGVRALSEMLVAGA